MDSHIKVLGYLNMVFGVIATILYLVLLFNAGGFPSLLTYFNDDTWGFVAVCSTILNLVLGPQCIIAGYFVRRLVDWSRVYLIILSAINMVNPPVGMLLGMYGLWVLLLPETDPLFQNAPAQVAERKKAKKRALLVSETNTLAAEQARQKKTGTSILPSTTE